MHVGVAQGSMHTQPRCLSRTLPAPEEWEKEHGHLRGNMEPRATAAACGTPGREKHTGREEEIE